MNAWTFIYAAGATVSLVATMSANMLSHRPETFAQHLHHLSRWGICGASAYALARVLTDNGQLAVWPEQAVMSVAIAAVTILAGNGEAKRQKLRAGS